MPQIRPITDLRNTNEISDLCHARREPIFITKNGYGDAAISDAEAEFARDGQLHDAREALASLRRKHFE